MPIDFQPFDPRKPVRIYRRNLPHWRQDGATYFVTFRLADALPEHHLRHLEQLRVALAASEGSDDAALDHDRAYFRTMERYLEAGHGSCVLRREPVRAEVEDSLRRFDGCRYQLGESAVMPNHVHALVRTMAGWELERVVHGWKSFTANRINHGLGCSGPLWQEEFHDRIVRDEVEYERTIRYILNNPRGSGQKIMPWEDR